MIPLTVYRTRRPWWRRTWQAELTINDPPSAVTAFTERGAHRKGARMWDRWTKEMTT